MSNQQTFNFEILDSASKEVKTTQNLELQIQHSGANYLIHRAFKTQCHNERNFTASTKTRSEVQGGGRKPWKQKGTGRARAGSNRSPLWKGGGIIFGPKPKISKQKLNKKEKKLAIQTLLANKIPNIIVVDKIDLEKAKTSELVQFLKNLTSNVDKRTLIITTEKNSNLNLAARNLKNIQLSLANQISIKNLLRSEQIILDSNGLESINKIYAKI